MIRCAVSSIALFFLALAGPATAEHQVVAPPGIGIGLPFSPGVLSGDLLFLSGAIGTNRRAPPSARR